MSFSAGFARGAHAWNARERTELERQRQEENKRRFDIENKRAQAVHDEQMQALQAKKGLQNYENFIEAVGSNPEFYTDGQLDLDKAAKDHTFQTAFADMVNKDPVLLAELNRLAPGAQHKVKGLAGLVPGEGGRVGLALNVEDAEGNMQTRPLTANRSSDPADPVKMFTADQMDSVIRNAYGQWGKAGSLRQLQGDLSLLQGAEPQAQGAPAPAPAPGAQDQALSGGATTSPATTQQPPPEGTPYDSAAPEEPVAPPQPPPGLAEQQKAYDEESKAPTLFERGKQFISGVQDSQALSRLDNMLDVKNPGGRQYRMNPMQGVNDYVRVHDKMDPADRKAALDHLRPELEKRQAELEEKVAHSKTMQDKNPLLGDKASGYSVRHKRMQNELDEIKAALDPQAAEQPPVKDPRVSDVSTPAKVEAKVAEVSEPTDTQVTDAANKVMTPTKSSVRSGKPSGPQLMAAMRLHKKGILDGDDVVRYARTGKLGTGEDDYQFLSSGGNLFVGNKKDGTFKLAFNGQSIKSAKELRDREKQGRDEVDKMLKDYEIPSAEFWRRITEESRELAARGLPSTAMELAGDAGLQSILVSAVNAARKQDRKAGWFTPEVEGQIRDYIDNRYPNARGAHEVMYAPDGRPFYPNRFAEANNMDIEDAKKYFNDYVSRNYGGSQKGTDPLAR